MNCPVPNTHKRLLEAHRLWHQCLSNYFDPEGFRTNLNATIQSLRNLTFALQGEKDKIPGFDEWYSIWQERMKKDNVLRWLNEARVKIVHQRDLETESIAIVKIKNYYDIAQFEFRVPPFLPSSVIAQYTLELLKRKFPEQELKKCFATIERRWIDIQLPEWELLDALAYVFKFLSQVVLEAHEIVNYEYINCSTLDTFHKLTTEELKTGIYKCMEIKEKVISETIVLSNFSSVKSEFQKVIFTEDIIKKNTKRYKPKKLPELPQSIDDIDQILKHAEELNEIAKQLLVKDKFHIPIFYIHIPGVGWEVIAATPEDQTDKFIIMRELANRVKKSNADALIHISEVWMTNDLNAVASGIPVSETRDKKEALTVTLVTKNNIKKSYVTFFERGLLGNIKLKETVTLDFEISNYLQPIIQVWK